MSGIELRTIVILSCVTQLLCAIDTNQTDHMKPESLELLNVIKQDLRRDNDDYAEHRPRLGAPRNAYIHIAIKPTERHTTSRDQHDQFYNKKRMKLEETRRRAYNPMPRGAFNPRFFMNKLQTGQPHQHPKPQIDGGLQFQVKNQYPKKYTSENTDKMKAVIEKNSGNLRQYTNKKRERQEEAVKQKAYTTSEETEPPEPLIPGLQVPRAEQLDMGPAKGGRIHSLRLKGRLCHRNVMIPEGPKYDSKGKIYLPEHDPLQNYGRDFQNTKPPALVLPKCCNCCRKSVLGCE